MRPSAWTLLEDITSFPSKAEHSFHDREMEKIVKKFLPVIERSSENPEHLLSALRALVFVVEKHVVERLQAELD